MHQGVDRDVEIDQQGNGDGHGDRPQQGFERGRGAVLGLDCPESLDHVRQDDERQQSDIAVRASHVRAEKHGPEDEQDDNRSQQHGDARHQKQMVVIEDMAKAPTRQHDGHEDRQCPGEVFRIAAHQAEQGGAESAKRGDADDRAEDADDQRPHRQQEQKFHPGLLFGTEVAQRHFPPYLLGPRGRRTALGAERIVQIGDGKRCRDACPSATHRIVPQLKHQVMVGDA